MPEAGSLLLLARGLVARGAVRRTRRSARIRFVVGASEPPSDACQSIVVLRPSPAGRSQEVGQAEAQQAHRAGFRNCAGFSPRELNAPIGQCACVSGGKIRDEQRPGSRRILTVERRQGVRNHRGVVDIERSGEGGGTEPLIGRSLVVKHRAEEIVGSPYGCQNAALSKRLDEDDSGSTRRRELDMQVRYGGMPQLSEDQVEVGEACKGQPNQR